MRRWLLFFALAYFVILLAIAVAMHSRLNQYWLVTLWLFSPRWVAGLPMLMLFPLTLWFRPKLCWGLAAHALLIGFPILGFQIPSSHHALSADAKRLVVLTCNLGDESADTDKLVDLIGQQSVDIVCLQECPPRVSGVMFADLGWNYRQKGNLAIGSTHRLGKLGVHAEHPETHHFAKAMIGCDVLVPGRERFRVVSIHLPTFRPALEQLRQFHFDRGPEAMAQMGCKYRQTVNQAVAAIKKFDAPVLVAGDFNVPVESAYYRDYWTSMVNAFGATGMGLGHTKFTRLHGVRIDHILADDDWIPIQSRVCGDVGSDHRPLIAEFTGPHGDSGASR